MTNIIDLTPFYDSYAIFKKDKNKRELERLKEGAALFDSSDGQHNICHYLMPYEISTFLNKYRDLSKKGEWCFIEDPEHGKQINESHNIWLRAELKLK